MQKIIAALTAAIAFVFSSRDNIAKLKQQIADRDTIIADLRTELEDENTDDDSRDAALVAAQKALEKSQSDLAKLNEGIQEAEEKAIELAASISADPAIPLEISEEGKVTKTE